jgi:hypothetical protein
MCIFTSSSTPSTPPPMKHSQSYESAVNKLASAGKKRSRRSVCFAEHVSTFPRDSVSPEELETMWYQPKELHCFKLQVRDHILAISPSEEKRGLERYTLERSKNKQLAIKCTVLAYKKNMSEESIASVAKKCSSWFQKRAFLQACHDYFEVYHPEMVSLVPPTSNTPPKLEFLGGTTPSQHNKRPATAVEEEFEQRRVRVRTV